MITMGKPTITVVKPPKNQERCQQCPPGVACLWVCAPGISTEEIARKLSESFTGIVFRASETCPAYDVPVGEPENPTLEIWDYVG
jgi:hypothetical protein